MARHSGLLGIAMMAFVVGTGLLHAGERPVVPSQASVYVQYQYQSAGSDTWTTSSTTLKGAVSESMMKNQISQRHPGKKIRILSAKVDGKTRRFSVRYQMRHGKGAWNTNTTILQDALTESMARNQLCMRHPGQQIRILSMVPQ